MLTNTQKQNIAALRIMDYSYRQIGSMLNISEEAVRKHCIRNDLNVDANNNQYILIQCQNCGKYMVQKTDREKKYCSPYCRRKKWRELQRKNNSPKS